MSGRQEEAELRVATAGNPDHAEVIEMVEALRLASTMLLEDIDDPNRLAKLMTASCMFAGTLFGTLIVSGIASDKDKRRVTEIMANNFRSGIDVGKARALRIGAEMFGGTA